MRQQQAAGGRGKGKKMAAVQYNVVTADPATHSKALENLIRELAEFERMPDGPQLQENDLRRDLEQGRFYALLAILTNDCGELPQDTVVGYLVYYYGYSTWQGQQLVVEDIYVKPQVRRIGIGAALFQKAVKIAYDNKLCRVEWNVLAWNEPAIQFYNRMGSINLYETEKWVRFRLERSHIEKVAESL